MKDTLTSFLLSRVVIDSENIYYKDSSKEGTINIKDITYLNYEEAKLFKTGYLLIRENMKVHRIPFDEKQNASVKELINELKVQNKKEDEIKPLSFKEKLGYYYSEKHSEKKQEEKETPSFNDQNKSEETVPSKEQIVETTAKEASEMIIEETNEPTSKEVDERSQMINKSENKLLEKENPKLKEKKKSFGESLKGFVNNMEDFSMKVPHIYSLKYLGGHPSITSDGDAYLAITNGEITLSKGLNTVKIDNIKSARFETEDEIKRRYTATRIAFLGIFALAFKKQKKIQHKFLTIGFAYEGIESVIILTGKDAQKAHGTLLEVVSYYKKKEREAKEKKLKEQEAVAHAKTTSPKPASVKAKSSKADELMKLKGLVEEGYLTKEEFLEAKKEILDLR